MPDKLYGRRSAIARLVEAYEEVADRGSSDMALVSGPSGVGKSALVGELHRQLTASGGLIASGKCDQSRADIPYVAIAAALGAFLSEWSERDESAVAPWRSRFREALGENGQLLIGLIPELEAIIGPQPPAPVLPALEAKNRFHLAFRRFLKVLCDPGHPFVLFIDDMQWADAATLDLLSSVLADFEIRYFLLLGAYRSNEVDAAHPLMAMVRKVMAAGTRVHEIALRPLRVDDIAALLVDGLRADRTGVQELAELVHRLADGSPFFSRQLVAALAEGGDLAFDRDTMSWSWDVDAIRAGPTAQRIADLVADRLARLPEAARALLQTLACVGNRSDAATLGIAHGIDETEVHHVLSDIVRTGLLQRVDDSYGFLHDKVQEAAYASIPDDSRAVAHLRIGRAMLGARDETGLAERVFEVVGQFNRGADLIAAPGERLTAARLNMAAARSAKASTAYAAYQRHIRSGLSLMPADAWTSHPAEMFEFEFSLCESEFLLGHLAEAEAGLAELAHHPCTLAQRSSITWLRITLFTASGEMDRAVQECLCFLEKVGIGWVAHPSQQEILQEYAPIRDEIERGEIEDRLDLPAVTDPIQRITLDVLTAVLPPAFFTDNNLVCLVLCRMATISRAFGNSDASSLGYAYLGMILGPRFNAWEAGYRFGELGFRLATEKGLDLFKARVQMTFAYHVMPYTMHITKGRALLREAFDIANDRGDLTYAGFSSCTMVSSLLFGGEPLEKTQALAETKLRFVTDAKFSLIVEIIATQLRLIRSLRGSSRHFPTFNDDGFDEDAYEKVLEANPDLAIAACWYWIRKLELRLLGGEFAEAVAAAAKAAPLIWTSGGHLECVEYHFHAGLAHAAACYHATPDEIAEHLRQLRPHSAELQVLAEQSPGNFAHRAALLEGEVARLTGQPFEALRLYEVAIASAARYGFTQIEALAHETAARLCRANGLASAAQCHTARARDLYLAHGADAKARQLQASHPDLAPPSQLAADSDMAALLQTSQAVSEEVGSEKLIETLMTIVLRHSGASRGLLILPYGDRLRLEAESTLTGDRVEVRIPRVGLDDHHAPYSIIRHVVATRAAFLPDDAGVSSDALVDRYIAAHQPSSLLCLPLVRQGRLLGVLYLENRLLPHAFTAARISLLTLLASQVAISLENASLEEKESLLKEVHHRVKNNLQLITSLLNLQAARATDPAVSELLEDSRNRVRSMAMVHENLYRAGNLARVSMDVHIQSLCAQLFRSYGTHRQRIQLASAIDDIQLDLDRAIPCGLLVNELVSNALKHAFPDSMHGSISVTLSLVHGADRQLELSVADDGIGLPDGGISKNSLGLQLVDDLTHQLRGTLFVDSAGGTRFTIRFPAGDEPARR